MATFIWGAEQQEAFDQIREAVICAAMRVYPNSRDPFILDTDASDIGIGAELIQV